MGVFGLRGPSTGSGTVNKRLRTKSRSCGSGRDLQGPRIETINGGLVPRAGLFFMVFFIFFFVAGLARMLTVGKL